MIAIKDMEMPKTCIDCELCHYDEDYRRCDCAISEESFSFEESREKRIENCPLVEIITCKDCIHRDEYGCRHGHPNCNDNFYCANGEKERVNGKVYK